MGYVWALRGQSCVSGLCVAYGWACLGAFNEHKWTLWSYVRACLSCLWATWGYVWAVCGLCVVYVWATCGPRVGSRYVWAIGIAEPRTRIAYL